MEEQRVLRMLGPQNEPRGEARGGLLKGNAGFAYRDAVVQPDRD